MTMRGTHQGEFTSMTPTGQQVEVSWMQINRIVEGKQAEIWTNCDFMDPLRQIGASPEPSPGGR